MNSNLKKALVLSFALTAWDIFPFFVGVPYPTSYRRPKGQTRCEIKDYVSGSYHLRRAIHRNDVKTVKRLLALGVDPNRGDCSSSKDTPLIIAAQGIPWKDAVSKSKKDEATIIELLIAAGADVNGKNGNGRAPLAVAVYFGNREAIKVLIKHGAHLLPEEAVLRLQYGGFEPDQKRVALYGGALRELLDDKNLDKAIYRSIQDFLKVKVDINSLKIAIKYGNVNSVKSLLDVGLRLEDVDKETLMHPLSGCYHYNEKMVAFLIEQGFLLFSPAEVIKWRQGGGNVKAPDHFTARDYIDTLKRMLKDKNTSKKARQYAQNFLKGIEEQKKGLQRK